MLASAKMKNSEDDQRGMTGPTRKDRRLSDDGQIMSAPDLLVPRDAMLRRAVEE